MHYHTRYSSRAKRIIIKIESPDKVEVVAPPRTPQAAIKRFVDKQQNWIKQKQKQLKRKYQHIDSSQFLMIFGQKYQKHFTQNSQHLTGIYVHQQQIVFNFPNLKSYQPIPSYQAKTPEQQLVNQELETFLQSAARVYFYKQLKNLAAKMKVSYNKISIRQQKTRWGSCSQRENINLNWRLVHLPPKVIDYVLIHELAHIKHANHSRRFWKCVSRYDPDYQQHRKYLKKHAITFN